MARAEPPWRLELAGGVSIALTPEDVLRVERPGEPDEHVELGGPGDARLHITVRVATDGRSALLARVEGDRLLFVAAATPAVRWLELVERLAHATQLHIEPVARAFVVISENGLLCIDAENGQERWRLDRVTFDWTFVAEREGAVWLSDAEGNLLGFDLTSGDERA